MALVAWTLVLFVSSCRKPEEDIGLDLLPSDRLEVTVDTAELHAFTVADTSIRTNALSKQLLGSYLDPQFGSVKAGIITQIRLPANNIGIDQDTSGLVADSLVLAFAFDGINYAYGNLDPQIFQVYELGESLSIDSSYRSDRIPVTTGEDLTAVRGGRIKPQPLTEPVISGETVPPQLRIPLSQALANRLLDAFRTSNMANNELFLQFFKGFYVTVDASTQLPNEGGILYFDLISSASKVSLYYRDLNGDPLETERLDLAINSNCVRYTVVEHDRTRALDAGLTNALLDTTSPQAATYLQALAGVRTAVRFPDIMDFAAEGQLLAKAELVVPVKGTYYPYYPPTAQIFLFMKDEENADAFLPDQQNGIGAIDGFYRPDERAYRFNITRYVQGLLNGTYPNTGIQFVPGSSGVSANRVILSGPASLESPMRLQLTFTEY